VEHWSVSIFGGRGNWTGGEELQLLDSVELYGFGNWELVSQHVETRSPEEVRDEYISRYLDGNIGKATWAESRDRQPMLIDHVPEDNGPLSPLVISRLPPLDATPEEAQLLGYKPHRDDYEREYDMSAEQLVSSLQLDTAEDTDVEVALKLSMVDMYTRRLRERAKRKRIVRDYQLVAKFFSNQRKESNKRPLSKEQREFRENMKVFSQFLTSSEHEQLINNIEREKELRHRLSELMRYRSLGLTTQEEVIHQEQHMAYQKQQQLKQSKSARVKRNKYVNRNRLYQFAFHLGQQWLSNISSGVPVKKRKKRRKPKFIRKKLHVASTRRARQQQLQQLQHLELG
jgi:transcriptional adapter 2-beta